MNYDPYYLAMTQMGNPRPQVQDIGGLSPVFQNIAAQQASQNAAMQQGQALTQAAGQTGQGGGMNPMAMAAMLRKGKGDNSMLGARMDMALNSQASPYLKDQVAQLGSSTSNPFSNYNMGTGGFGNYGE
jgi:hypothetical protein